MPVTQPSIVAAPERRDVMSRDALVHRVFGEFNEMPCLRLTSEQAQRLFGMPAEVCQRVLADLVKSGTLVKGGDERFRLNDSRTWPTRQVFMVPAGAAHSRAR
jgi:hypothetical protein